MKQQGRAIKGVSVIGWVLGASLSTLAVADNQPWSAPAPMGPYGGHFDFGIPLHSEGAATEQGAPQAEHAVYQQQEALPVINASYARHEPVLPTVEQFSAAELAAIDPAWELQQSELPPQPGLYTAAEEEGDVWALGEINPQKSAALTGQPVTDSAAEPQLPPCRVETEARERPLLTSAHTPFQEAVLDEFEQGVLDMESMWDEADRLSRVEEQRGGFNKQARAAAPVYFSSYMPDYALGVRQADAMDPLALTPQKRSSVQYFGFRQ